MRIVVFTCFSLSQFSSTFHRPHGTILISGSSGVSGSGVMGRERKEEVQIVDMLSSSKSGSVLRFRRRMGTTRWEKRGEGDGLSIVRMTWVGYCPFFVLYKFA